MQKQYSVKQLCGLHGVSRQSYYKQQKRAVFRHTRQEFIVDLVKDCRKVLPKEGCRKLQVRLKRQFAVGIGRDTLFDILRSEDLLVKRRKRYARTTNSKHGWRVYPNLLKETPVTGPNQGWASDITYLSTAEGFCFLALITDVYSRYIVGYDISDSLEMTGCIRALNRGLKRLPENHKLIHHSDRGVQYCSAPYTNILRQKNIKISMAAKGDCYENALAERVNGILKDEHGLDSYFRSKSEAIKAAKQAVKLYNEYRYHSCLSMQTPASVHF